MSLCRNYKTNEPEVNVLTQRSGQGSAAAALVLLLQEDKETKCLVLFDILVI